jgi:hypothetical protein
MSIPRTSYFRHVGRDREKEFIESGYKKRHFFPHTTYYLPKCGPDGFKLAKRMYGSFDLEQLWEVVLYADASLVQEFPEELFFDPEVVWHQQQFGKTGQLATANLVVAGSALYSMVHVSDIVQRISRRREHKTRIENRFKGWTHMLMNSILNFAYEKNLSPVFTSTADLAHRNTDPARNVGRELFERVYDRTVQQLFTCSRRAGWWVIDLKENRRQIVLPERKSESLADEKTICVCHDVEMGFGHRSVDVSFARFADETSTGNLAQMLTIENKAGVKATYNVLGMILPRVRTGIEQQRHSIGFHSFDHRIERTAWLAGLRHRFFARATNGKGNQLALCRDVDYRIKGYRPPQSKITAELTDENLCFHNFEWLASSTYSLGIKTPELRRCIVKIPILLDDFDLYRHHVPYEQWEQHALADIERHDFFAISLHDCYGHFWLPHYEKFLKKMSRLGRFKTLDQVASETILASAQ